MRISTGLAALAATVGLPAVTANPAPSNVPLPCPDYGHPIWYDNRQKQACVKYTKYGNLITNLDGSLFTGCLIEGFVPYYCYSCSGANIIRYSIHQPLRLLCISNNGESITDQFGYHIGSVDEYSKDPMVLLQDQFIEDFQNKEF